MTVFRISFHDSKSCILPVILLKYHQLRFFFRSDAPTMQGRRGWEGLKQYRVLVTPRECWLLGDYDRNSVREFDEAGWWIWAFELTSSYARKLIAIICS